MQIDGLAFAEAVERLANKYGVQLRREEGDVREDRPKGPARLIEAHREAQEFYAGQLATPDAVVARQFLAERGFDEAAAELFGIGFAPARRGAFKHLRQKAFSQEELVVGGLVAVGRSAYDRFRGRLLWPIRDASGDTLGFGARRIFDDDRIDARYLNTSNTDLQEEPGALRHRPRPPRHRAVLPGRDRRGLHRCDGLPPRGRADRGRHLRHGLRRRPLAGPAPVPQRPRGVPRRGDLHVRRRRGRAEGRAARSGGDQNFVSQDVRRRRASGMDLCDLRIKNGDAAVRELVARRVPLYRFVLANTVSKYDLDRADGRVDALREAARLVSSIRDRSKVDAFSRELAGMIGVDVEEARAEVRRAVNRPQPRGDQRQDQRQDRRAGRRRRSSRPRAAAQSGARPARPALRAGARDPQAGHPVPDGDRSHDRRGRCQRLHPPDLPGGVGADRRRGRTRGRLR